MRFHLPSAGPQCGVCSCPFSMLMMPLSLMVSHVRCLGPKSVSSSPTLFSFLWIVGEICSASLQVVSRDSFIDVLASLVCPWDKESLGSSTLPSACFFQHFIVNWKKKCTATMHRYVSLALQNRSCYMKISSNADSHSPDLPLFCLGSHRDTFKGTSCPRESVWNIWSCKDWVSSIFKASSTPDASGRQVSTNPSL